jgi:pimeloyl-ACP methyl ester carboxylesterase
MKVSTALASAVLASSVLLSTGFAQNAFARDTLDQGSFALPDSLTAGTFQQDIDHTGLLPGQTFAQRYWVDSEYATSPNAPVIYHICGEGDAETSYFLHDNAIAWAQALGAHLVYLEHRYYGKSLPFSDFSNDHMTYLTLNNELEDLATFQRWITKTQGFTGKWISVGGSYSGTISALYRFKHPELVVGALAASAPMVSGQGQDQDSADSGSDASSTDPSSDTGDRPWIYESCTTFGFWETDGSTLFEPSSSLCQQLFGNNVPHFDATTYNQTYYQPFITGSVASASNILFSYGSDDIWTTIGIPQTGFTNPNISVTVIQGAGHHFDLNYPDSSDSQAVLDARAQFLSLAKKWLGQASVRN